MTPLIDTRNGLTNEQIAAAFPSVFADEPHESRSSRYLMLPTYQILNGLRSELGYVPTQVMQQRSRMEGQIAKGKHLLRLRHMDYLNSGERDVHEVIIVNSHNGASAYKFLSGVFQGICENGCIFGTTDNAITVQHRGSILDGILEATFQIASQSVQVMEEIEFMKTILLSWQEQLFLAEAAMVPRFDGQVKIVESDNGQVIDRSLVPFQPADFLRPRRYSDATREAQPTRDLYTTYRMVQENMIEKPVRSRQFDSNGHRHSTRAINGIDGNVKINAAIWEMTRKMAEIKTQAE